MMWSCIPTAKTADTPHITTTIMNLTAQQLVDQNIEEVKRLAPIDPSPSYILGCLMVQLEFIIELYPQAREYVEQRIAYSETQPTPTR